jgi:hypothetical protein
MQKCMEFDEVHMNDQEVTEIKVFPLLVGLAVDSNQDSTVSTLG